MRDLHYGGSTTGYITNALVSLNIYHYCIKHPSKLTITSLVDTFGKLQEVNTNFNFLFEKGVGSEQ